MLDRLIEEFISEVESLGLENVEIDVRYSFLFPSKKLSKDKFFVCKFLAEIARTETIKAFLKNCLGMNILDQVAEKTAIYIEYFDEPEKLHYKTDSSNKTWIFSENIEISFGFDVKVDIDLELVKNEITARVDNWINLKVGEMNARINESVRLENIRD